MRNQRQYGLAIDEVGTSVAERDFGEFFKREIEASLLHDGCIVMFECKVWRGLILLHYPY